MSCGRVIDGICAGGSGGDAALAENIDGGDVGDIVTQTDPDTTGFTAPGVAGTVLTSNGVLTLPSFQIVSSSVSAVNLDGGDIGDIATQTAPSTTGFTVPSTSGYVLTSNGPLVLPTFQPLSVPFTLPTITQYTSGSGTFNSTAGCKYIEVYLQAGGGGSGGGTGGGSSPGGGGGGFAYFILSPGSYSYTVGSAGAAGTSAPTAGGSGGSSTFGVNTVNGGSGGGTGQPNAVVGGNGGTVTGSALTNSVYHRYGGQGGTTHYDASASNRWFSGRGGSSFYTGPNPEQTYTIGAQAGRSYGGGASGTNSNVASSGAAGVGGYIRIVQYF